MKFISKPRIQTFYESLSFEHKFNFWTIIATFLGLVFSAALSMLVIDNSVSVQSKLSKIEYVNKVLPSYLQMTQLYGSTFYDLQEIMKKETDKEKTGSIIKYYSKNKNNIVESAEFLVDSVAMKYSYYTIDEEISNEIRSNNGCILILTKIIRLCNDTVRYSESQVNDSIKALMKSSRYVMSSLYNTNVENIANTASLYYGVFKKYNNVSTADVIPITYLMQFCVKNWILISRDMSVSKSGFTLNLRTIWFVLGILVLAFIICNIFVRFIVSPYRSINNKDYLNLQEKYNRLKNENRNLSTSIDNLERKNSLLEEELFKIKNK